MNINATLIGQTITFVIFVWFCMKYVWPPIITALEERQSNISTALASAEKAKLAKEEAEQAVIFELEKAKVEAQQIVDAANKRRNEILDSVQAEAELAKAKIIEQGYAEIESERKRVQEELRKQVAALAVAGAEKIVGRTIDEAANNDIIDKLVAEL